VADAGVDLGMIVHQKAEMIGKFNLLTRKGLEDFMLDTRSALWPLVRRPDLVTGWLILKRVTFRHGYKVLRATQNLVFKGAAVEGVRRNERGLIAGRDVVVAQRLHVIEFG
jgi:hypothetical protein